MDRWYDNINKKEHYKLKKCSSSVFSLFYVVSGTAEQLWDSGKGGGRGGRGTLMTQYLKGHKTLFLTNSLEF